MPASVELQAFPRHMRQAVGDILPLIAAGQLHPPSIPSFRVVVDEEVLVLPRRVYYDADRVRALADHDGVQGRVALCLGTIHHDGFLREECAGRLIQAGQPWVVPFVVNLVGEYVLEIVVGIEDSLASINNRVYGKVLAANSCWFATIERRVVSYWNVYYRAAFPQFINYPGARVIQRLGDLAQQSNPAFQRTAARPLN